MTNKNSEYKQSNGYKPFNKNNNGKNNHSYGNGFNPYDKSNRGNGKHNRYDNKPKEEAKPVFYSSGPKLTSMDQQETQTKNRYVYEFNENVKEPEGNQEQQQKAPNYYRKNPTEGETKPPVFVSKPKSEKSSSPKTNERAVENDNDDGLKKPEFIAKNKTSDKDNFVELDLKNDVYILLMQLFLRKYNNDQEPQMNHSKSYANYTNNAKAIKNGNKKNYRNKGYSGHSIDIQQEENYTEKEIEPEGNGEEYFEENREHNFKNHRYSIGSKKRNYNENGHGRRSYNKFNGNGYTPVNVETKMENEIWDVVLDNKPEPKEPVAAVKKSEGKVIVSIDPKKKSLRDMFN